MSRIPIAISLPLLALTAFAQEGATLYKQNCASCHEGGMDRAPRREALRAMSADQVLAAMETGPMISMASRRTAEERRAIAQFVTGKALGTKLQTNPPKEAMCAPAKADFQAVTWNGW